MDLPSPLSVSPVAELLIGLVQRRESGTLALGERTLQIARGELQHVSAAPGDSDFGEFLVRSGRLSGEQRARISEWSSGENISFEQALAAAKVLNPAEMRAQKRALWLDRFARSLRKTILQPTAASMWTSATPQQSNDGHDRARLLPLLLDALSRIALDADAAVIGRQLNYRLNWLNTPLASEAKRWASFGDTPEQPPIAALLAKLPASAPQIAALVRAGFVSLTPAGPRELPAEPAPRTLPPPPPRLSNIPMLTWSPPPAAEQPRVAIPRAGTGPRIQLDPGSPGSAIDDIPDVSLTAWPERQSPLQDPLRETELALQESREGVRRAQLFVVLAELWESRIGSLEEAARSLREAASADPHDPAVLAQTADHCFKIGHGELAVRYAAAAVAASEGAPQRAAQQRMLARQYEALGQSERAIELLSEAATEHAGEAWPHEWTAQLLFESDRLPLAAAHLRFAAAAERVRDPQHALALYALAYGWDSENAELATEYADALNALGHPEAAIAILAQTARQLQPPHRQALQLQAAQRAENHKRRDLAGEILLELLSVQPELERSAVTTIWQRLDASWDRPGMEAERAALLESFACASSDDQRARWFAAAGRALAQFESETDTALRYLAEAARLDASQLTAAEQARLSELDAGARQRLEQDASELCSSLEAELWRGSDRAAQRQILVRLAALRAERRDPKGVVSACLRLLSDVREDAHDAHDALAVARLWRATAALPDPVLRSEALTWLARMRSGRDRGRALAMLALELEAMHDFGAALASAEAALAHDPGAADAALIALRHLHRHKPEQALPLLATAQRLLAAPPAVMFATAEAAAAASAPDVQVRALNEISRRLPYFAQPRQLCLEAWLRTRDVAQIVSAAEDLLAHAAGPASVRRLREAVTRLAELNAWSPAARLAEQVLAAQGKLDPAFADTAYELARKSEDPTLGLRALERAASAHVGPARAACLFQLATRHGASADRAAELRALLRAAAVPEGRLRALELLALRFAECGDLSRLLTVLSLRLDGTTEPGERRHMLLDMASAAVNVAQDRSAAAGYLRRYFQESGDDRDALLLGLGALFALGDDDWAFKTARECVEELPTEVAAVMFLWLAHRAELSPATQIVALELASQGAKRFPAAGELLLMAERITLARRDRSAALGLYSELLVLAVGPHGRRALHYRAGRWLERSGTPEEALVHYQQAFALAPSAGVAFAAIERCARATGRYEALIEMHCNLAEQAPNEARRTAMLGAAVDTCMRDLKDPLRALQILLEAEAGTAIGSLDAQLFEAARAATSDAASGAGAGGAAIARDYLAQIARVRSSRIEQLWDKASKAHALLSLAHLHARARRDWVESAGLFAAVLETDLREELSPTQLDSARRDYAAVRIALPIGHTNPPPARAGASSTEEELRARMKAGDLVAFDALIQHLSHDEARREEAHALLGQLVRTAPERTDALRDLHRRALVAPALAEARICQQILSIFDPDQPAPDRITFPTSELQSDELWQIVHPERDAALARLMQLIWEHARTLPQLRPASHLEALGMALGGRDRTPLGQAFERACARLARPQAKLYAKANLAQEISVLPGPPPVLVARAGLNDGPALEFQIARAIVSCEPEHAIVTALSERDARRFLTGVVVAFGTKAAHALTRSDVALASQLAAAVPERAQHELRELLNTHAECLDYPQLKGEAERAAARAGLLVCADVTVALQTLARTLPSLGDCEISDEAGFQRACRQSTAFAEVVRTALSLPFVGLTTLALEARAAQQPESMQ